MIVHDTTRLLHQEGERRHCIAWLLLAQASSSNHLTIPQQFLLVFHRRIQPPRVDLEFWTVRRQSMLYLLRNTQNNGCCIYRDGSTPAIIKSRTDKLPSSPW